MSEPRKIRVEVGASTDTATEGTDYETVGHFDVTVPKGKSSGTGTFTLKPKDDTLIEPGERISITGSGSSAINGRKLTPRVTGTNILMTDNENIVLSASPATVGEGDGSPTVTVTAAVVGGGTALVATPVEVTVGSSGDTATKGTDYTAVSDFTITIPAGKSSATGTFSLPVTDDSLVEATEKITIAATKKVRTFKIGTTEVGILDNDNDPVTLTVTPLTRSEAAGPTKVGVRATGATAIPMARTITVDVGASADSATEGTDYTAVAPFTITIPANDTTSTGAEFTWAPIDDSLAEPTETITVSGTGTNFAVTGASLSLTDDDGGIALSASPSTVVEGGGAKTITVTATGVGTSATARTVTVQVGKSGDGATEGTDYATVADFTMSIPANATSGTGTFTLTPTDDTTVEGDESITVSGTSTGTTVTGTSLSLIDDDARIALSVTPSSVTEGLPAKTMTVTATANADAFLADSKAGAYARFLDSLLASPRYGEHLAAMWLDAGRYADTNGYQTDGTRSMWRWRDWVIGAFNRNLAFDQFTIEQLAGDMLPNATRGSGGGVGLQSESPHDGRGRLGARGVSGGIRRRPGRDDRHGLAGPDDGLRPLPRPQVRPAFAEGVLPVLRVFQQCRGKGHGLEFRQRRPASPRSYARARSAALLVARRDGRGGEALGGNECRCRQGSGGLGTQLDRLAGSRLGPPAVRSRPTPPLTGGCKFRPSPAGRLTDRKTRCWWKPSSPRAGSGPRRSSTGLVMRT